ncbi:hypothetical protein ACOME3_004459 [Neoechinorhynchus agilis]
MTRFTAVCTQFHRFRVLFTTMILSAERRNDCFVNTVLGPVPPFVTAAVTWKMIVVLIRNAVGTELDLNTSKKASFVGELFLVSTFALITALGIIFIDFCSI